MNESVRRSDRKKIAINFLDDDRQREFWDAQVGRGLAGMLLFDDEKARKYQNDVEKALKVTLERELASLTNKGSVIDLCCGTCEISFKYLLDFTTFHCLDLADHEPYLKKQLKLRDPERDLKKNFKFFKVGLK